MQYTQKEKAHIDNLLAVFHEFISQHSYFDIGYADKVGYVHFHLNNDSDVLDCMAMKSFDDILVMLFDEVADDVRNARVCAGDEAYCLYPNEIQAVQNFARPLLEELPTETERSYCIDALDTYCRNNAEDLVTNPRKSAEVSWGSPRGEEVW